MAIIAHSGRVTVLGLPILDDNKRESESIASFLGATFRFSESEDLLMVNENVNPRLFL